MKGDFQESRHLLRMAVLFGAGFLVFLVLRGLFIPADFGVYGHFRAGAIEDNRKREMAFAGRTACGECHGDVVETKKGGKHRAVGCEACHGALGEHARDPDAHKAQKPDPAALCQVCHLKNVARPRGFPQIDPKDHGDGGPCAGCHAAHRPDAT